MADNKKISGFGEETDLTLISGIAGYRVGENGAPNYNVKISGENLKESVLGDYEPTVTWNNIANKPSTFPPTIGTTATDALAGNTTTISTAQATAIANSLQEQASGIDTRVAFFGGDGQVGGSSGLTYTSDTLSIGNTSFAGTLQIYGNYLGLPGDYESPKITFYVDNPNDANESYTHILEASGEATGNQRIILPSTAATTTGQVLSSSAIDGTKVTTSWVTPTTSGGIDFSGLNINTIKANLSDSTQAQYGSAITIKAAGAISNGDIVAYTYDSGEVKGGVASSLPSQNTIAGVAIQDIADGQTGKVLIYGYATVNYNNILPSSPAQNIALTSGVSGNVTTLAPGVVQPFSDSGGTGQYTSSETYTYTFDSGSNAENVKITVNSFDFEGESSSAFDRLGFQESDSESGPYVNCAFSPGPDISGSSSYNKGWRRMDATNWQSGGGTANDITEGPYADGYVLPANNENNGFSLPQSFTSTKRYLKCFFYSDGFPNGDGWDIDVETTAPAGGPTNTPLGGLASLNINDLSAATNQLGTGRTIGISVGGTHANNSAVVFVEPPRVQ